MNNIVILCSGTNCGKTATLNGFFQCESSPKGSYVERKFNGVIVCAVSFGSPQEQEDFCEVKQVNDNIDERIKICESNTNGKSYIFAYSFHYEGEQK